MQRISLAPVLSATRSRDSCWITSNPCLPGLLEDLDDAPALRRGQRPGLHEEDAVADARSVLLVVRLELVGTSDDLAVQRVLDAVLDGDDDGLFHLVADDQTLPGLAETALVGLSHILLAH